MRPRQFLAAASLGCLSLGVATSIAPAQGTPIFTEDQKILASDGAADDQLGYTVSVCGDLLLLGAHRADDSGGVDSGAAYIYRFDGSEWVEEAKLTQPDGAYHGYFGWSVAIHNDIAVVCSYKDSDPHNPYGAAYVYRFDGEGWIFEAKCVGDEYASTAFGQSLAASDDFIVVGDPYDTTDGLWLGAASVFRYNGNSWGFESKLRVDDVTDSQGWGVAADGNRILLGSNAESDDKYVAIFRWTGAQWAQDARMEYTSYGDWYGRSVDIMGNLAIAGSADDGYDWYRGKAYIYKGSGAPNYEWALNAIIEPSDLQYNDFCGEAVAIADEETVIVQSMGHELDGYGYSTLYVFREIDSEWTGTGRLTTSDTGDFFGYLAAPTLSAGGAHVVVGSPKEDNQNGVDAGSAFYFNLSCPEDLNGNGYVDQPDLGILLASYEVDDGGDIDGDGDTDQPDLGLLLAAYETWCK